MLAGRYGRKILQLIIVRPIEARLLEITSAGKSAKNIHRRQRTQRVLARSVTPITEPDLVYRPDANHLRVADLKSVLGLPRVVGLGREGELLDSLVQIAVVPELVSKREDVVRTHLV